MQSQAFHNQHPTQTTNYQQNMPPSTQQPASASQAPNLTISAQAQAQAQAQQLQHFQRFAPILQLPMFPLYTESEAIARQKEEADRQQFLTEMAQAQAEIAASKPQLSTTDKIGIHVLEAATGTTLVSAFSMDKMTSGLISFSMTMDSLNAATNSRIQNIVYIVRWASPPDAATVGYKPVIVDVLEVRGIGQEEKGANIVVRVSRDVRIKVGGKYEKKIKRAGKWTKTVYGRSCDVEVVEKGVGVFPLEVVMKRGLPMAVPD
ncbi:hypothetical protein DL98DRAFT_513807 [Cadophora sp. DSE1049]|nr:hypothetical protein DL98DRAFT_513807 [Cadophora sp. DSE1049]